jgi:hypothetical protein
MRAWDRRKLVRIAGRKMTLPQVVLTVKNA